MDGPPGGTYGGNSAEFPSVCPFVQLSVNLAEILAAFWRKWRLKVVGIFEIVAEFWPSNFLNFLSFGGVLCTTAKH